MPVYYDEEARGYRLSSHSQPLPAHLRADEFILMRIATEILSRRLNGPYSDAVMEVIEKLEATGPPTLNDLWHEGKSKFWADVEDKSLDSFTNSLMLQAAIALDNDVSLVTVESSHSQPVYVRRPSLCFKDGWSVCSKESDSMPPIPLADIKQVILETDLK